MGLRTRHVRAIYAALLVALAAPAPAQPLAAPPRAASSARTIDFKALAMEAASQESPAPVSVSVPPDIARADLENLATYVRWQRDFARASWEWHLFSTKLLMYVVLVIVAIGLLLTYLQFTREGRPLRQHARAAAAAEAAKRKAEDAEQAVAEQVPASTLKLGPTGLEITSQVIGLLVLGFSLAFFYLYVKNVYPMQDVELQRNAQAAGTPTGAAASAAR